MKQTGRYFFALGLGGLIGGTIMGALHFLNGQGAIAGAFGGLCGGVGGGGAYHLYLTYIKNKKPSMSQITRTCSAFGLGGLVCGVIFGGIFFMNGQGVFAGAFGGLCGGIVGGWTYHLYLKYIINKKS